MNLLRRVKAELPTCQLLIVLVRETQAVVHEAMEAYADVAIFKSSLGISVETVKTHVVNAKDKLGAADRTQLAVMALLYGLIDPLG